MNVKIEIKDTNTLVITNTDSGEEIVDTPKRLVYYDISQLTSSNNIRIFNINEREAVHQNFPTLAIGAGTTDGSSAFTVATWKTFARTNLGK